MNLQNKNVLVTGGAGFIGSCLVGKLLEKKSNVFVFDNFSSGRQALLKEIKDQLEIIEGEILDKSLAQFFSKNNIEVIFHLAAKPFIPSCYTLPKDFFETNANGTLNVLLSAEKAQVKRLLYFSSSEVYGSAQVTPMKESHPLHPLSTYAVSKLAAERLVFTFSKEHELDSIIQRQFNVFGPRETHPYIIPEIISQLSKSNKLKLGNISSSRDFTFVEDCASASIALMKEDNAVGGVFNCSTKKDFTVKEIAQTIANVMGKKEISINTEKTRFRPLDVQRLVGDFGKLNNLTGWKPKVSFEHGLQKTIEWFNENKSRWPYQN